MGEYCIYMVYIVPTLCVYMVYIVRGVGMVVLMCVYGINGACVCVREEIGAASVRSMRMRRIGNIKFRFLSFRWSVVFLLIPSFFLPFCSFRCAYLDSGGYFSCRKNCQGSLAFGRKEKEKE